jgi:hypothetical protein
VARGLTPNELRELRQEHGSWEAVMEARPDLADQIRSVEQLHRSVRQLVERIERPVADSSDPDPLLIPEGTDIERQAFAFELALDRHARSKMEPEPKATKPGPKPHDIPRSRFAKALALLEVGELSMDAIARESGVDRHDVAKIRDWRNGRGYEVHPGSIPHRDSAKPLKTASLSGSYAPRLKR